MQNKNILHIHQNPIKHGVVFEFEDDDYFCNGGFGITLDDTITFEENDLINAAATLIISGYFLPSQIIFDNTFKLASNKNFNLILQMIYDIRAYCSQTNFKDYKAIIHDDKYSIEKIDDLDINKVVLLFSGGIDSTYSLIKLKEMGKEVIALFIGINIDTQELEWEAAKSICSELKVPLIKWSVDVQGLPMCRSMFTDRFPQFAKFPYYNSIPHGRDIINTVLGVILARKIKAGYVALGQEKESREKVIQYKDRLIYRHDVESEKGSILLQGMIDDVLFSPKIISPISDKSIFEIRSEMCQKYLHILEKTQSCFWNRFCGKCIKCISFYLICRMYNTNFKFGFNPLADHNNKDLKNLILNEVPDNEVGYGKQIKESIRTIIKNNLYTKDDYWILQFVNKTF